MPIRPNSTYDPKYCDIVLEIGEQGGHVYEMARACQCGKTTLYRWAESHPEFKEAFDFARDTSKAFVLEQFRLQRNNPEAQPRLYENLWKFHNDIYQVPGLGRAKNHKDRLSAILDDACKGGSEEKAVHLVNLLKNIISAEQEAECKPMLDALMLKLNKGEALNDST